MLNITEMLNYLCRFIDWSALLFATTMLLLVALFKYLYLSNQNLRLLLASSFVADLFNGQFESYLVRNMLHYHHDSFRCFIGMQLNV